jgi:hypothetical protein
LQRDLIERLRCFATPEPIIAPRRVLLNSRFVIDSIAFERVYCFRIQQALGTELLFLQSIERIADANIPPAMKSLGNAGPFRATVAGAAGRDQIGELEPSPREDAPG